MDWTELTPGRRLKVACQTLDLTLEQVAARAGVSIDSVWSVASGRREGSLKLIRAICDGINLRLCWYLEGEGEMFRPQTTKTGTPEGVPVMRRAPSESVTPAVAPRSRRRDVQQP